MASPSQDAAEKQQLRMDHAKTRMQEVGYCRVATFSFAEVAEVVSDLGLDPDECFIDVSGWLYLREAKR